jgi:hypothetical protein
MQEPTLQALWDDCLLSAERHYGEIGRGQNQDLVTPGSFPELTISLAEAWGA